jgi:hypothetical protein
MKWALALPKELAEPPALAQLSQLVSYKDFTGELSRSIGGSGKPGQTFPGASAISKLGRDAHPATNNEDKSPSRPDRVKEFYDNILSRSGVNRISNLPQLLKIEGANPSLALKIFDRYWGTAAFPLDAPNRESLEETIGPNGEALKSNSTLRSAVYFLMRLYVDLDTDSRAWLSDRLRIRLSTYNNQSECPRSLRLWWNASEHLFGKNPAATLAAAFKALPKHNFELFASTVGIPAHSSLFSSTRLETLCLELHTLPHRTGESQKELLNRLYKEKDDRIDQQWTVSAKALEILVNRSISELGSMPSDDWCNIIVDLGCHPDPRLSGQAFQRYWHWADSKQLDAARMAFVRRDLEIVFEYLRQAASQGQLGGHMVAPRVDFYKKLLRNRLIRDTRLFLGTSVHWNLRNRMKRDQFWDLHEAGDPDLCILALKLADNVNLTTGTKSFPMRFYRSDSTEFGRLWEQFSPKRRHPIFNRDHFKHDLPICIRKTHQGDWKWAVINQVLPDPFLGRVDWSHYDL